MDTPAGTRRAAGARFFGSLRGYRVSWLRGDLVAGLTVWAVLVPESLAYATIAGVPPVVGLYAAVAHPIGQTRDALRRVSGQAGAAIATYPDVDRAAAAAASGNVGSEDH